MKVINFLCVFITHYLGYLIRSLLSSNFACLIVPVFSCSDEFIIIDAKIKHANVTVVDKRNAGIVDVKIEKLDNISILLITKEKHCPKSLQEYPVGN
jgi:hypothetical protein